MRQPYRAAAFAAGAALVLTASVASAGSMTHRDAALRAAIETAVGFVGVAAALLVLGRFAERGRLGELVLGGALLTLGTSSIVAGVLPLFVTGGPVSWAVWVRFPPLVLGAAALALSPWLLGRALERRRRLVAGAGALVLAAQVASALVVHGLGDRLPAQLAARVSEGAFDWRADASTVVVAGHLAVVALSLAAAVGFGREARRAGDRLLGWIGLGCALAAVAHLHYALSPTLYSEAVSAGDVFRLAFYGCVLVGTVREVSEYQRALAAAAVTEERRRLARELHDGLAQELAFLLTQARLVAARHGRLDGLELLEQGAERALDESRLAIGALTRPGYEPLDAALARAAEELAHRTGADVRFRLAPGVDVEPELRDALVRIVREAMTNAVRHGRARTVRVELENGTGLRLLVSDDGGGFAVDAVETGSRGFGLVSMRERAEALGGRLSISSRPGRGTRVEVVLP